MPESFFHLRAKEKAEAAKAEKAEKAAKAKAEKEEKAEKAKAEKEEKAAKAKAEKEEKAEKAKAELVTTKVTYRQWRWRNHFFRAGDRLPCGC